MELPGGGLLPLPLLLLLLLLPGGAGEGSCAPHASCAACLRAPSPCAWCEEPDFPGGLSGAPRCAPRAVLEQAGCPPRAVLEPQGRVRLLQDQELDARGSPGGAGATLLRPQKVQVLLRPGQEQSFRARFRRPRAPPLDLYYLLDLSYSMRDDLQSLRRLGRHLLAALRNASAALRLGFGSFVDKPVIPYASTVPSRLQNPCPEQQEPCAPPAAFRHLLALSPDPELFWQQLAAQRPSGNLDAPEGGFDAIMQVALCQELIGWGPATRLLVFATDDVSHTAGDGKLGGAVLPPDARCRLDARGLYAESQLYDYPSVPHLAQVLSAARIQVVFAVAAPTLPLYQNLSLLIPGSVVGELQEDSGNVVQLIADAYERLSSTVELQHSALPPGISLSYQADCGGGPGAPRPRGGRCEGVGVGQEVTFTVRVRAGGCLGGPQQVVLRVLGLAQQLALELETLCQCPCAHSRPRAPQCHGGDLVCGVCRCPRGRWGRRCECEEQPAGGAVAGGCSAPNRTQAACGGCERHRGQACGGPTRGECVCGACRCRQGFAGSACGCALSRRRCQGPGGRQCSGHGTCVCGACRCQPGHRGALCQHCPSCPTLCQRLRDCADCGALGRGPLRGNCSQACPGVSSRLLPAAPPAPRCREPTPDGRLLLFSVEGRGDEEEEEGEGEGAAGHVTVTVWQEEEEGGVGVALGPGVALAAALLGLGALGLCRLCLELRSRRQESDAHFSSATADGAHPGCRPQRRAELGAAPAQPCPGWS